MPSENEFDLDDELDDILHGLEKEDNTGPGNSVQKPQQDKSIIKTPSVFTVNNEKAPSSEKGKVRFQEPENEEDFGSSQSVFKKQSSSNLINSKFFPVSDVDNSSLKNEPKVNESLSEPVKPKRQEIADIDDDWLGIKSTETTKPFKDKKQSPLDVFMTDHNFALPLSSNDREEPPKPVNIASKPPIPPPKILQSQQSPKRSIKKPSPSLDSFGESRMESFSAPRNISKSFSMEIPPPKLSLAEALPFLLSNNSQSPSMDGSGDINETDSLTTQRSSGKVVKKKAASKSASLSAVGGSTLQLPSHLVNEDELKAMSSSLKTLYANQLELQEESYREQLDFFGGASKRKEEFLKEELNRLQEDYELRVQKLKSELLENDLPQKLEQVSLITSNLNNLSSQLVELKNSPKNAIQSKEELSTVFEQSMKKVFEEMEMNFTRKIGSVISEVTNKSEGLEKINSKIDELSHTNRSSLEKLVNGQTQFKNSLLQSISDSIHTTLLQDKESSLGKKDKSKAQMKQLRKDLKRLYLAADSKNDQIHTSQLRLEMEQRTIIQSVRDINANNLSK